MPEQRGPLWIDYKPLTELAGMLWSGNPKDHDVGLMHELYTTFGFVAPVGINEANGQLLWGHGRIKTAMQRKAAGDPPPDRVVVRDGEWYLPVVRGISMDPEKGHRYVVADNRATERGGWEDKKLADALTEMAAQGNIEETGYDGDDLDKLLEVLKPTDYSDFDRQLEEDEGFIEVDIKIRVARQYEGDVKAWLAYGEPLTAAGMGKGVLRRCGLL